MTQNLVSLHFTAADMEDLDVIITGLEDRLTKLIALTPEQRRGLTRMGDKSEAFCRQTLAVLGTAPGILPADYDLPEAQKDLADIDLLRPRFARITKITERARDSEAALGSDVMVAALEGYAYLKVAGKAQGLTTLRQSISARFARGPKTAPAAGGGLAPTMPAALDRSSKT